MKMILCLVALLFSSLSLADSCKYRNSNVVNSVLETQHLQLKCVAPKLKDLTSGAWEIFEVGRETYPVSQSDAYEQGKIEDITDARNEMLFWPGANKSINAVMFSKDRTKMQEIRQMSLSLYKGLEFYLNWNDANSIPRSISCSYFDLGIIACGLSYGSLSYSDGFEASNYIAWYFNRAVTDPHLVLQVNKFSKQH